MSNLHNEIKYGVARLNAFRTGLGMGEGEGVMRLGETLTPVVALEDRIEWLPIANEHIGWGTGIVGAGGAGLRSMVALAVPQGSGIVAILESFLPQITPVQVRVIAPAPVSGIGGWATSANQGQRDLRDPANALRARVLTNNTVGATGILVAAEYAIGILYHQQAVIGPNNAIIFSANADNLALSQIITWRERRLLPGEPGVIN